MGFNALTAVKYAVSGAVGLGAHRIVKSIITNNVPTPENLIEKIVVLAGAWGVSGVVVKAAKKHSDDLVDDLYTAGEGLVKMFKLQAKLGRINRNESTFDQEGLKQENFIKEPDGKWHPAKKADEDEGEWIHEDGLYIFRRNGKTEANAYRDDEGKWVLFPVDYK